MKLANLTFLALSLLSSATGFSSEAHTSAAEIHHAAVATTHDSHAKARSRS